jgi:diaminohydroxyphosphoribosylaminopyrimidine deaminase/5-amino-6-(5-phosphoribosylamino)uracil reductase
LHLDSDSDTILVTGATASKDGKAAIEKKGAQILEASVKDGLIDLDILMETLGGLGVTSLLIEGGSRVIASSLAARIVDKVIFFYAPRILGGDDGIPICSGAGPELMSESIPLKDIDVRRFGDDIMIEGYIDPCSQVL